MPSTPKGISKLWPETHFKIFRTFILKSLQTYRKVAIMSALYHDSLNVSRLSCFILPLSLCLHTQVCTRTHTRTHTPSFF